MAKAPLSMRKIESVLSLRHQGLSVREIGLSLSLSPSTVNDYLRRATAAGISWPLAPEWGERELHQALFEAANAVRRRPQPDCAYLHGELRKKGVTLQLLHEEYLALYPDDGYRYSQFCERYRRFRR